MTRKQNMNEKNPKLAAENTTNKKNTTQAIKQ